MGTVITLKQDLQFNQELSGLIEALKAIAVTQFRIWEKKMSIFAEFHDVIEEFLALIDPREVFHPFITPKSEEYLIVGITSDTGLLGALNLQVVNACVAELEKHSGQLVIVGERGEMYLSGTDIPYLTFPGVVEEERYQQAIKLKNVLLKHIVSGKAGGVKVIYPRALSITVQRIEMVTFLPYELEPLTPEKNIIFQDLLKESLNEDMVTYLIDLWVERRLYEIMGLSKLAEFAARVVHLEESSQKLKDLDKETRRKYFRARHEIIDQSMRELFAARSIYSSS